MFSSWRCSEICILDRSDVRAFIWFEYVAFKTEDIICFIEEENYFYSHISPGLIWWRCRSCYFRVKMGKLEWRSLYGSEETPPWPYLWKNTSRVVYSRSLHSQNVSLGLLYKVNVFTGFILSGFTVFLFNGFH